MRGGFVLFFSFLGLFLFSFFLFVSNGISFFWLFMELCGLSLVPLFFVYYGRYSLVGLFYYLVVSSVASSFVVCGILCESFLFLTVVGFFIKFGIFPFFGWVYMVVLNSNLFVVWGLSTLLKAPFFLFPFFLSSGGIEFGLLETLVVLSFFLLSVLFWVYSSNLLYCWAHMMISSSVVLVVCSFVSSVDSLADLYFIYFFWSSFVIGYLAYGVSLELGSVGMYFLFVFLFLSFPFSFSLFYKLLVGPCLFSCSFFIFLSWVFYSVSEQLYLFSLLLGGGFPRGLVSLFNLV